MAQETRQKSNRDAVVRYLREAAAGLRQAATSIESVADALDVLKEARRAVKKADALANNKPKGYRPLPARIRHELAAVAKRIEDAERRIKETPVTKNERSIR